MCLAIPARVVSIEPAGQALVELSGVRKLVSLVLVDDVELGDYVIVHVGYALAKLDPSAAAATLDAMRAVDARPDPPVAAT
jgi:hydrogenase expression/formation protein HypC